MLLWAVVTASSLAAVPLKVEGHSASDAYLTLTSGASNAAGDTVLHGQWDIALRDLDFVLRLDEDGDGRLTWGEVLRHQAVIERYAYEHLTIDDEAGHPCSIRPERQMVDGHADGTYAALFFEAVCARGSGRFTLHYDLFFAIDPSHRAIAVMHNGPSVATAVLSPQNSRIELAR
jgi:hypothetical protein